MNNKSNISVSDTAAVTESISGLRKAALLFLAIDVETASSIIKYLDSEQVEKISTEIAKIKNVPSKVVDDIIREFHEMVIAREYVLEGGIEYAQMLLEKSLGVSKAQEIIEKVKSLTTMKGFDFLKKADSAQLVSFLSKEHPQTIALILSHLSPDKTAEALRELPSDLRADVAFRIATLGKVAPHTLKQIEKVVDELAGSSLNQTVTKIGGTKSIATILNKMNVKLTKEILENFEMWDPDVTQDIKRQMFLFDDIINIADRDIQKILKEVDRKDLALSLKIADEKLKEKIFKNMSERAADLLKEELQYMGMVRLKEVEAAQAKIIDVVKNLEENGEIAISGGSKEDMYV
jgi:flagellar motor switch protein FliG